MGLRPNVTTTSKKAVIEAAELELSRQGDSIESLAGVQWKEDEDGQFFPERELSDEEIFTLSVKKLGDDGRLYEVFEMNEEGARLFIEAAEEYGLGSTARDLVERFNS